MNIKFISTTFPTLTWEQLNKVYPGIIDSAWDKKKSIITWKGKKVYIDYHFLLKNPKLINLNK